jgi:hypothetical protein
VHLSEAEYERLLTFYRKRVDGYPDAPAGFSERWRTWCTLLLGRGGALVVPHHGPDAHLENLIASAIDFPIPARPIPGSDNQCHRNVAALWARGEAPAIGTGYALSSDELWRQHSWAIDTDGTVLETTSSERLAYIGLRLESGEQLLKFVLGNAGDVVKNLIAERTERSREIVSMVQAERAKQIAANP